MNVTEVSTGEAVKSIIPRSQMLAFCFMHVESGVSFCLQLLGNKVLHAEILILTILFCGKNFSVLYALVAL